MSEVVSALGQFHRVREQAVAALRPHARPLVLGCMLAASVLAWTAPAASQSRCMLVQHAVVSIQTLVALSMAVTTLAWYFHKPILRRARALRDRMLRQP
jgi:hypothetical protein